MPKLKQVAPILAVLTLLTVGVARADQLAEIKKAGTLICGTLGTAEPFSFPNPQTREIQGYDIDFCAAIAKSLGVKLEIKPISVPARIPELQQSRVDVLAANLGWTAERAEQIAFSESYFVSRQMAASRRADKFKSPADLSGKRVALAGVGHRLDTTLADAERAVTIAGGEVPDGLVEEFPIAGLEGRSVREHDVVAQRAGDLLERLVAPVR